MRLVASCWQPVISFLSSVLLESPDHSVKLGGWRQKQESEFSKGLWVTLSPKGTTEGG